MPRASPATPCGSICPRRAIRGCLVPVPNCATSFTARGELGLSEPVPRESTTFAAIESRLVASCVGEPVPAPSLASRSSPCKIASPAVSSIVETRRALISASSIHVRSSSRWRGRGRGMTSLPSPSPVVSAAPLSV
ncbi:hypothetical protein COEREDRAFT_103365 [Coemansia reversa NRRL 1564]|uniref:Uncharacterized protein n=1 Tax=Coemansia reversa (strain ATCC 12441 / NRRL 1564) TaxID=763665 RepID=A0A2G5B6L9_COERN|nr:hypothetical protein COEREDRAFT_103365 [Coemansia reversa NRRL 1564]|eukprot:PIA14659.1 hypothetical protein COEREDRAFT_103365 [Coemansia reversa NRRL 1564]